MSQTLARRVGAAPGWVAISERDGYPLARSASLPKDGRLRRAGFFPCRSEIGIHLLSLHAFPKLVNTTYADLRKAHAAELQRQLYNLADDQSVSEQHPVAQWKTRAQRIGGQG